MNTDAGHDVLRVLDQGVVISGEVQVRLLGLKVLPVKVNLLISSVERAESLGLSWWGAGSRPAPAGVRESSRPGADTPRQNGPSRSRSRRGKRP